MLAKQWAVWREEMRVKQQVLEYMKVRAEVNQGCPCQCGVVWCVEPVSARVAGFQEEFVRAMDTAGQVYLFGKGKDGQFTAAPRREAFRGWTRVGAQPWMGTRIVTMAHAFVLRCVARR